MRGEDRRTRAVLAALEAGRPLGQVGVGWVLVQHGTPGPVPLRGLEKHFLKLPHNIKPKVVNELDRKFKAMGGAAMPIPKGPMPRGGRVPRR